MPLTDALTIIRRVARPIADYETVPLAGALGRALAESVIAPRSLPPFNNTAVDGYAFRHADTAGAPRVSLMLSGESAAGVPFTGAVPQASAIRISTGAVLPDGADTVAMQEDCIRDGDWITIDPIPETAANVRLAGGDIHRGEIAVAAGRRLRPQDIALVGALGLVEVPVTRRLRVVIASTGSELRERGADLADGQIVETNALMLAQLLAHYPVDITVLDPLPDDRARTEAALLDAGDRFDLILTTGGVSVGDHDHVRPALAAKGRVHFWRLALRPGKPVLFGEVGSAFMLGLPGNPVSAMVTFLLVVLPVLRSLLGCPDESLPGFVLPLAESLTKSPRLREFPRARLEWSSTGAVAALYRDQGSNLLTSLSWADGLLDLGEGTAQLNAGDPVIYRPFSALLA